MRGKVKALSLVAKTVLLLVCLVMVIPSVIRLCPFLVGADASYVILGGSMRPTLSPGDLVFTVKVDLADIEVGDIIVVKSNERVYMHRVVEKEESLLRLKGDANDDPDSNYVNASEVIGKTVFSLPMGYLYTRSAYMLVVATPLMLLAVNQAIKIYSVYNTRKRRRRGLRAIFLGNGRRRRKISILDMTSSLLLIILAAGGTHMMTPYFASRTGGFFTDTESSRSVIQAATWRVSSSISCSVDPSTIKLGENVTVYGSIEPARRWVDVKLTYECNGTRITRTVKTDDDGAYVDVFAPDKAGVWRVQACWNGDNSYSGAASNPVTVSVEPHEGGG